MLSLGFEPIFQLNEGEMQRLRVHQAMVYKTALNTKAEQNRLAI
jgi:hypothetical protein